MSESNVKYTEAEALEFHSRGRPGKIEIIATKPMATQRDLALAYSPGVAVPVRAIAENPGCAYDYTAKGNLVAVISNGTAILGLGNLGALASKPVMEGKAVLFKRFADVDAIDIEVKTEDAQRFIDCVELLEPSFGGINLEDIAAPDCFIIEQTLRERMNIPVFHDDQHGTAIITAAGLINACLPHRPQAGRHQGRGERRRRRGDRLHRAGQGDGRARRQRHHVRPQGRDLQGPHRPRPVEVGACGRDRHAHAGRGARGRRRLPRPVGGGRAQPGDGQVDGQGADHLRHGQSRPGDLAARRDGGAARRDHRHRPLRLSQPGQQRPRLPLHLPRRPRCARDGDQRRDEDRRRRSAGRAGARAGAGGSGRGLWRAGAQLRARLHHPRAVRSAADGGRRLGRRRSGGRSGVAQRPIADHGGLPAGVARAAQPDGRGDEPRL